jgi:hypothetical protein
MAVGIRKLKLPSWFSGRTHRTLSYGRKNASDHSMGVGGSDVSRFSKRSGADSKPLKLAQRKTLQLSRHFRRVTSFRWQLVPVNSNCLPGFFSENHRTSGYRRKNASYHTVGVGASGVNRLSKRGGTNSTPFKLAHRTPHRLSRRFGCRGAGWGWRLVSINSKSSPQGFIQSLGLTY